MNRPKSTIKAYIKKMKGSSPPLRITSFSYIFWSWLGAFLGISAISHIHFNIIGNLGSIMLVGSFGASAVLIYGAIKSPLAQPRNLIGGHIISALIGVTCYKLFPSDLWLASALAVSTAIAVMQFTHTLHPPGGATSLIAVIGGSKIHSLGYLYAVIPVGASAFIMLGIALLVNNIPKNRQYPDHWF